MGVFRDLLIQNAMKGNEGDFGPLLPIEYQEIEYIDVNQGAQFNTHIIPTYDMGFYIRLSMNHIHDENNLMGCMNGSQKGYFAESYSASQNTFVASYGSSQWNKSGYPGYIDEIYDHKLNYKNDRYFKISNQNNRTYSKYLSRYSEAPENPLYIGDFKFSNLSPTVKSYPDGKIYYLELTDHADIIKKYIPCRHIITGEVGMYEVVDGEFFKSETDVEFIAGPDVYREKEICPSYYIFGEKLIDDDNYQQLESITSTGRQKLEIPINATLSNVVISTTFLYDNKTETNQTIWSTSDVQSFMMGMGANSNKDMFKIQCGVDGTEQHVDTLALKTWYTTTFKQQSKLFEVAMEGKQPNPYNVSSVYNSLEINKLNLFANAQIKSFASLKRLTIDDETAGIHIDLVPALRKSDGCVGLYNIINGEFYTDDINRFVGGKYVFEKDSEEWKSYIKPFTSIILPDEYQQVKYIESHGKEYINTGIMPDANTKWVCDYQFLEWDNPKSLTRNNLQVGGGGPSDNTRFSFGLYKSYTSAPQLFGISLGRNYMFSSNTIKPDLKRHTFLIDSPLLRGYIDSNPICCTSQTNRPIPEYPIHLFARQDSGVPNYLHSARCYSNEVFSLYMKIQHLIPCYRKEDGEVGMYDIIQGEFFTNSSRTGELTAGPVEYNIGLQYTTLDSCTATKQQYINTNYHANQDTCIDVITSSTVQNSSWHGIFGARDNYNGGYRDTFSLYKQQGTNRFRTDYDLDSNSYAFCAWNVKVKYRVVKDANISYCYSINNKGEETLISTYAHNYNQFTCKYPIYFFTVNDVGNPNAYPGCDEQIYRLTIKDKKYVVHDYIPCLNELRRPGYYDRITHTFHPSEGAIDFYYDKEIFYPSHGMIYDLCSGDYQLGGLIDASCYNASSNTIEDIYQNATWNCYNMSIEDNLLSFVYGDNSYATTSRNYRLGINYYMDIDCWINLSKGKTSVESALYAIDFGSVTSTNYGFAPFGLDWNGAAKDSPYPLYQDNYKFDTNDYIIQTSCCYTPITPVEVDGDWAHYIFRYGCVPIGKSGLYKQVLIENGRVHTARLNHVSRSIYSFSRSLYLGRGVVDGYSSECKIKSIKIYTK